MGAAFLALQVYIYTAWVLSDKFTPTPTGDSPLSDFGYWFIQIGQVAFAILAVYMVYWMIKTCRREGRAPTSVLFCLAFLMTYWQDPLANYYRLYFIYTSHFFNFGSWCELIPGWIMPRGSRFPEPLLFGLGSYIGLIPLTSFVICAAMRKAKARWPQTGTLGLMLSAFVVAMAIDLVLEIMWVRTGLYQIPGAIRSLSLWGGMPYQLPLYEVVFWGALIYTPAASLLYFKDDKGNTVVERGIENFRGSTTTAVMRCLALAGFLNAFYLLFNMIMWFISFQID
ncbi:MAG: hypothetical protein CL933_20315, partial [Deltaproteobacteria bacterium]|nr:hypothetical protein [Deltaproteobacteria bacterium]